MLTKIMWPPDTLIEILGMQIPIRDFDLDPKPFPVQNTLMDIDKLKRSAYNEKESRKDLG
jgi:hypothetical protein